MLTRNYYLVNKETRKVHCLFKLNPNFMSKDGNPETWLAGRVYHSPPECAVTLEQLYGFDYSDEYVIPDRPCDDIIFETYADVSYASVKGYRLFNQGDGLRQAYDDFGGNDLIEMNAFLANLFVNYIGPEEVKRWSEMGIKFVDDYGVNELVMEHFTIESDEHEGVYYHRVLTDDPFDWNGFPEHK